MATIASLLVRLGVDAKETDTGLQRAESAFSRFSSRASSMLAGVAKNAAVTLAAVGTLTAGITAKAATIGVKAAAQMQQNEIAFTSLLKSGDKARKFLADLSDFAAKTPFELPGLVDAARQLIGVGRSAESVIPTLTAFGNASGALGLSQEQFQRVMLATTQALAKGKLQGEELMQMTEAGIPIWPLLSKALGKPVPVLQDLASKGKLLTKDVLPKLEAQMQRDYGGAMAAQSQTLTGLWSTLTDAINIGLGKAILPLAPLFGDVTTAATSLINNGLGKLTGWIEQTAVPAINLFRDQWTKGVNGTLGGDTRRIIAEIGGGIAAMMAAFKGAGGGGAAGDLASIGQSLAAVGPVLRDLASQVPSLNDILSVTATVLRFAADHSDLLAKALPYLVAGFIAVKIAQMGANAVAAVSPALRIAEVVANYRLAASNTRLAATITAQTAALEISTGASVANTAAENVGFVARVRATVATVAQRIATIAGTAATWLATAATWALGAALAFVTSPIGLVILAIVALVAGLIYAYKHSEAFRKIVDAAWRGIVAAALWAWNSVLKPTLAALGAAFMWLWRNVVQPVWEGIKWATNAAWVIIQIIFAAIKLYITNIVAPGFLWLYNNVIKPVWAGIQWAIHAAWVIIQIIFAAIKLYITNIVAPGFVWLYNNVIKPVWAGILAVIDVAWAVIKAIFAAVKWTITNVLAPIFTWLYKNVIQPVWGAIKTTIAAAWDNGIKPVFNALGNFISDTVAPAFRKGVDLIKSAWEAVKEAAAAPVRFVVNTVINKGIIGGINWLAEKLGVKDRIDEIRLPFAKGGRVSGPGTGTSDSIRAWLSRGEYVIPAGVVGRLGVGFFDRLIGRRGPRSRRPGDGSEGLAFAGGGLVGALEGMGSALWGAITDPGKLLRGPVNALINQIPGAGGIRNLAVGMGRRALDNMLAWVKGAAGAGTVGATQAFLRAQAGKPYGWAQAGPGAYDCSGIISAAWNLMHGRNPYQHTFSTHSEAFFFPRRGHGLFTAGWSHAGEPGGGSVGHTAGLLAGLPFESRGSTGVIVGAGATPVDSFAHVGTYDSGAGMLEPGWNAMYNGRGTREYLRTDDPRALVRLIARELRAALLSVAVVADGQVVGRIEGRRADLYARGG